MSAENEFANLRKNTLVRLATKEENIFEHWDLMDSELGRVDVKAAKRKDRGGDIDYHIWWELKTVTQKNIWKSMPGWGVPNGVDRLIAIRHTDAYYLIKPEDIIEDLRLKCRDYSSKPFGLYARPGRGDLLTSLPLDYVKQHARHKIDVHD
jgi:hypothetical protein